MCLRQLSLGDRVQTEQLIEQITQEIFEKLLREGSGAEPPLCRALCIEKDAATVRFFIECGAARLGLQAEAPSEASSDLARYIDHTLLKPTATERDIRKLCDEAMRHGFASVCLNPWVVRSAYQVLRGSAVAVCTVVGFPLGSNHCDVKTYETRRCIYDGATEIDMVINLGALKGGRDDLVLKDISGVTHVCREEGALSKVIIEAAYLTDEEKVRACTLAKQAGADFVKTSTGFGPGGATLEDVALMRRTVGPGLGVKAAGGIGDSEKTRRMIEAGATRIGASAGIKIVQNRKDNKEGY